MVKVKKVSLLEKVMITLLIPFVFMDLQSHSSNSIISDVITKSQSTISSLGNIIKFSSSSVGQQVAASPKSAEFNQAVAFTLKHEGGLADDKDDTGGITNYGISYTFLHSWLSQNPQYLSMFSLKNKSQISPSIIKNLTKQQAIQIYNSQWWQKYHYGAIKNSAIAIKAFDYSVNMGAVPAIKLLQMACQDESNNQNVSVNGQLDSSTVNYINNLNSSQLNQLLYTYENVACNYYTSIVKQHPTDKKFLVGWLQRAHDNSYI